MSYQIIKAPLNSNYIKDIPEYNLDLPDELQNYLENHLTWLPFYLMLIFIFTFELTTIFKISQNKV